MWVLLWGSGLLDGLEQETMRWRYLVRGEQQSSAQIVYVDLDAEAIAAIGAMPWDRKNFSHLAHALLGPGQANVVGFDIIFSVFGGASLLDYERARAGDIDLGKTVKAYQDKIILAAAYTGTTSASAFIPMIRNDWRDPSANPFPEAPTYPIIGWNMGRLGLANVDEVLSNGVVPYWVVAFVETKGELYSRHLMDGMQRQLVDVLNEPKVIADEQMLTLADKDGWSPQQIPRYSEQITLSLGLEAFLAAHGLTADAVEVGVDRLIIKREGELFREVPLTDSQSIEVNWFEGWNDETRGATEHYSMKEVREQADALFRASKEGDATAVEALEKWFERFKGKVIFVGPVDRQLKDLAPTPFNREPVPKVGLHANLFRTLEDEAYIYRVSRTTTGLLIALLAVFVAFLALWGGFGRTLTRFGSICVVAAYVALVFLAFSSFNYVLPLVAPVGAAVSSALGVALLKVGAVEWQRRRIKTLFGAYVSPKLVDQMVDAQRDPELGGTEAEVTSLFSDVEGFSALSEQLPPDQLVSLMNEYLGAMTDALQAEGGTLDKYIGDAIVTMFGMPLPVPDHAARACVAAQQMQERHEALCREWAASGKWPKAVTEMRTRIGVNTGNAVIGNMGSSVRFNYTMMGDSVNLAARCESGAKAYGVYTIVTAETLEAALKSIPDLPYRRLDRIIVKGRSTPVEVFELWNSTLDLEMAAQCREYYEAGLELYFDGQWAAALALLFEAGALEPSRAFAPTTPSAVIAKRCQRFLKAGGPKDWDGAYRMETK